MRASYLATVAALAVAALPAAASAEPVLMPLDVDLLAGSFTFPPTTMFDFGGASFTFAGMNTFPDYVSVSTTGGAAVRTVFGNPSTDFAPARNFLIYDANILGGYGSFPTQTTLGASNGGNFLGLRVTVGADNYYGFAYTENTTLLGYGFETTPNTGIIPTTDFAAAASGVPEPATWGLMLLGTAMVGAGLRARRRSTVVSFA